MKLQLLQLGKNGKRFLQLCSVWLLSCFPTFISPRRRTLFRDSLFLLCQLRLLARLRNWSAIPCTTLILMMLLLDDFLGVRDVSWISHQFIDDSQRPAGRISQSIQILPQLFRCEQGPRKFADATNQVRRAGHFFNLADDGATDDRSVCKTPDFANLFCG